MAYVSTSLRRLLITDIRHFNAQSGLGRLYSNTGKEMNAVRTTAGAEFREMFSVRRMKKNWELLPLFIIIGGAVVGLGGYIVYASQTRDDVKYFSKANFETTDLLNPKKRKLLVLGQDYRPMHEVAGAYEAMDTVQNEDADNGTGKTNE